MTWNKRYRENMLHNRSGNLMEVAQQRNLWCREYRNMDCLLGKRKCSVGAEDFVF